MKLLVQTKGIIKQEFKIRLLKKLKHSTMKSLKINSKLLFINGFLFFFFINIFIGKTGGKEYEECQPYLERTNNELIKVKVMSSAIVPGFEKCVYQLEKPAGTSRRWMVRSYINLMKYYENIPGAQWKILQEKLNKEK